MGKRATKAPELDQSRPRSLRLRLMLWYGTLLVVALGFFGTLFLVLTIEAINQSVDSAVHAETRVASLEVARELSPTPPYWPAHLSLSTIDTFREQGVMVEIVDTRGNMRYPAATGTGRNIPISSDTTRTVLAGQTIWYTTTIRGEHVRVEASPMYAPAVNASGTSPGSRLVIGMLLVAKSLSDVDATLFSLQTLLVLTGLVTLAGTLIGSWIIATRVLRPLAGIVATARTIAASTARGTRLGNLRQRVSRPRGHDEMAQVVDTFNEMLAFLESASQTERRAGSRGAPTGASTAQAAEHGGIAVEVGDWPY